jgi:hypothetical protein
MVQWKGEILKTLNFEQRNFKLLNVNVKFL